MDIPLERFQALRILVVGDVMLDQYVQGSVERISPEAPVAVVRFGREWASPGGAGHVAACLAALGCRVILGGIVGDDREATLLREALASRDVHEDRLQTAADCRTTTKTRVLAGHAQQLIRIDREADRESAAAQSPALFEHVREAAATCDALVLSDYDKGALTPATIEKLILEARRQRKPVIVDPKKADFSVYKGASVLAPNLLETERALGRPLQVDGEIAEAAATLRADCAIDAILITRGPRGMTGADDAGAFHIPARVREVADVTGAGDTVTALLGAALAAGVNVRMAAEWASVAAGIAVGHPGTYVVAGDELREALAGPPRKVVDWQTAAAAVARARRRGGRIVFTNGCFDLLHVGHLHSLREARSLGDFLVVGLNSDAAVRGLKGPSRPAIPEEQRASLLAGLECVDLVVVFDEATPEALIRHLRPDVLAKGAVHDPASIPGSEFVRSQGGTVHSLSMIAGLSTSAIVKKIQVGP
jgi:D-beta-D-heptose 7-phosphate kinase/D-beta-D-heptose 1-phosphate adenosyltransferase